MSGVGAVTVNFQRKIRCAKETKAAINFLCSSDGSGANDFDCFWIMSRWVKYKMRL